MSDNTKIEWCDATWNPVVGCGGCELGRHCYAARMAWRLAHNPTLTGDIYVHVIGKHCGEWNGKSLQTDNLAPYRWRKPRRVFACSMGDLFAENVEVESLDAVFQVVADCQRHTFVVLTKRPKRMCAYFKKRQAPPNLQCGISATDQATLDARLPHLQATPCYCRVLSLEPLLGPVDLDKTFRGIAHGISHVIVGGETGPGARPMHPDWARAIRDQCVEAGVPFFLKKLTPKGDRELDGRIWEELP